MQTLITLAKDGVTPSGCLIKQKSKEHQQSSPLVSALNPLLDSMICVPASL